MVQTRSQTRALAQAKAQAQAEQAQQLQQTSQQLRVESEAPEAEEEEEEEVPHTPPLQPNLASPQHLRQVPPRLKANPRTADLARAEGVSTTDSPPSSSDLPSTDSPRPKEFPGEFSRQPRVDDPSGLWARELRWLNELSHVDMENPFVRRRPRRSTKRKRTTITVEEQATPLSEISREAKTVGYRDSGYNSMLKASGVHLHAFPNGVPEDSTQTYQKLLDRHREPPKGTIFNDKTYQKALDNLRDKNEARVIQDIARLIVPSVETLALEEETDHLKMLCESVDQAWSSSIPITNPVPQPDYAVGFKETAFTTDQLTKLQPLLGDFDQGDQSVLAATKTMLFPFLACEVKCQRTGSLAVADSQTAQSMSMGARAVVKLFDSIQRRDELMGRILSFSVSHNEEVARINVHFPLTNKKGTVEYHQCKIKTYAIQEARWMTYQFILNLYDDWVPKHHELICSALDQME